MTRPLAYRERDLHGVVADIIRFYRVDGLIAFHIPNEGRRSPREGAFLKRMLMLPGAPDFSITTPGGHQHWLELKTETGRTTKEQRAFERSCDANGSPYAIVRRPEEASAILFAWGALTQDPLAQRRAA